MNTNGPQAPYGKEEQRAPLLSDAFIDRAIAEVEQGDYRIGLKFGYKSGRDFYEAKITSGELMVVKKVTPDMPLSGVGKCPDCNKTIISPEDNFCPGCGAQIVK